MSILKTKKNKKKNKKKKKLILHMSKRILNYSEMEELIAKQEREYFKKMIEEKNKIDSTKLKKTIKNLRRNKREEEMKELCELLLKNKTRENVEEALKMIGEMGENELLKKLLLNTELRESQKTLKYCCKKKDNLKMIEKMVEIGCRDWKKGLAESCRVGCKVASDYLLSKGERFFDAQDWNDLLVDSLQSKNTELVNHIIVKGNLNFKRGLQLKHSYKQLLFFELIVERNEKEKIISIYYLQNNFEKEKIKYHSERLKSDDSIQHCILKACEKGDGEIIDILLSMGVSFDGNQDHDPLLILINKNRVNQAEFILQNSSHQLISSFFFFSFFFLFY